MSRPSTQEVTGLERVRSALAKQDKTQAELAKACKVSQAAISKVLSGERYPSARLAAAMVKALKLRLDPWELVKRDEAA